MGKYDKYVHGVNPQKFRSGGPNDLKRYPDIYHFDYRENPEAPHFIEASIGSESSKNKKEHVGAISEFPHPTIYYSSLYRSGHRQQLPNRHVDYETMTAISLDIDHPDDLGGTSWFWLGEGAEAEAHIQTKPNTILVPPMIVHSPGFTEKIAWPRMGITVLDSPLFRFMPSRRILPPGFENVDSPDWVPPEPIGTHKYDKYYNDCDVKSLPLYASHKGKLNRVMFYDANTNEEAPHCMDIYLIYGKDVGFGAGIEKIIPDLANGRSDEITSYEPFMPHFHPWSQTYSFISTDPYDSQDLGGTVEFWMGEGEEAEQFVFSKSSTILVPKDVVHLPMYVREAHRPFVVATILDSPVWAGTWSLQMPNNFKI